MCLKAGGGGEVLVLEGGVEAGLVAAVLLPSERRGDEDDREGTYGGADEVGSSGGIGKRVGVVGDAGEAEEHRDEVEGG